MNWKDQIPQPTEEQYNKFLKNLENMKVIQLNPEGNYDAFEKIRKSINAIENQKQATSTETWIKLYSMLYQDEVRTSKLNTLLNNKKLYI